LEEGILPGGGKALGEISVFQNLGFETNTEEKVIAAKFMQLAVNMPIIQILKNAGINFEDVADSMINPGHGYNVKTGEKGDLIKMGVIDPLKVTRSALQNAVSVAVTILSTNAIITMARTIGVE
jgi:chaperonin GroEL